MASIDKSVFTYISLDGVVMGMYSLHADGGDLSIQTAVFVS